MSGTELIMGMGEVINYLKELEAKNKKLQEEWDILNKFCPEEAENNGQAVVDWISKFFTIEDNLCGLEKENKKLKEKNKEFQESDKHLNKCIDSIRDQYLEQKEENKKLKEQNECLQRQIESVCKANDKLKYDLYELNDIAAERGSHNEALDEERVRLQLQNEQLQEDMSAMKEELAGKFYKHYEDMGYNKLNIARTIGPNLGRMIEHLIKQNKELKEEQLTEENAIQYVYENTDEYDDWVKGSTVYQELKEENKKLKEDIKELKEEFIDESESEEEKTKYDGDDWAYGYGFTVEDGEYRINMAGGGAHWTDYVINKDGCFIHNKDGMKKVRTFISCPEGNLIKVYDYGSVLEGDIKLDEGETDMYEMVKECYEEEIMNYVKEEDHIPTDSDEEEESEEEQEEEDVVFLYPNDEGSIQDPEHPEDYYSFGNNCKSKIGDNSTMKRILKNGSIKDCVVANAYCMFVKGGKLYYRGRSSRGPAHVRTIKGEKTTMEFPY